MTWSLASLGIGQERDVVAVRQQARRIADMLGFDAQDATRVATAVSEIARNAFLYAGGGRAEFELDVDPRRPSLVVRIRDRGPGIGRVDAVLAGQERSPNGVGLAMGIAGARRLMDSFRIETAPGQGTLVELSKALPRGRPPPTPDQVARIAAALLHDGAGDPLRTLQEQNRELIQSLDALRERQEELERVNQELEDTNRGVVALYAELDDKAEALRQASEVKSRFLSNMSHEFRTPLSSIVALSRLLLERTDGDLTPEQERQVTYISRSAGGLMELVNDLLDLAKVEAGKVELRPSAFTAAELFGALRGALRPLRTSDAVDLVFEDAAGIPQLWGDEGKIGQVLRNFVSNALKFTERGEVRVGARYDPGTGCVTFAVRDTGIGIPMEEQERIFEEFAQVQNPMQGRVKGTGLGLPLSRRLAVLLGGSVAVESAPGRGSIFSLEIPLRGPGASADTDAPPVSGAPGTARTRVLVVDDDEAFRYVTRQLLAASPDAEMIEATDGASGLRRMREDRPDIVLLDLSMPGLDGFGVLRAAAGDAALAAIPVVVATAGPVDLEMRARISGARMVLSKNALSRDLLGALVRDLAAPWPAVAEGAEAMRAAPLPEVRRPSPGDTGGAPSRGIDGTPARDSEDAHSHDAAGAQSHDAAGAQSHDAAGAHSHDADSAHSHDADGAHSHDADGPPSRGLPDVTPRDTPAATRS